MSLSDWITITLSLFGFCVAGVISWIFFRAQQNTDFQKISETLKLLTSGQEYLNSLISEQKSQYDKLIEKSSDISKIPQLLQKSDISIEKVNTLFSSLSLLQQKIDNDSAINEKLNILRELQVIKGTVENVNNDVKNLAHELTQQISHQQTILIKDVQEKFEQEIVRSRQVLFDSLTAELSAINGNDGNQQVVNKILALVEYALKGMGEFQRESIQTQTSKIFKDIENNIDNTIRDVASDVNELKRKVDMIALPVPK